MQDLSKPVSDNFAELLGNTSSTSGTSAGVPAHDGSAVQENPDGQA